VIVFMGRGSLVSIGSTRRCSARLAERSGLKVNTVCYNFRSHSFTTEPVPEEHVGRFPQRMWKLHSHPELKRESTEVDLLVTRRHQPLRIPCRRSSRRIAAGVAAPQATLQAVTDVGAPEATAPSPFWLIDFRYDTDSLGRPGF
jgi:hypothetical protein